MRNLKVFILGLLILGICTSVWALSDKVLSKNGSKALSGVEKNVFMPQHHNPQISVQNHPQNRGVIYYTDFADRIPDGWTTNTIQGPVDWEWTDVGGEYGGQLNSTTAANGYMIMDSNWYGTGAAEEADLISPAIDCSAYTGEVFMSVEHLARTFGHAEVYISMSVDDFATEQVLYSWYGAVTNAANGNNPVVSVFEIGDYAAGQSNVKFKFKWKGAWDYWWLVDDFRVFDSSSYELTMLDPLGEGVVSPAVGVYNILDGSVVNLYAVPDFGYTFGSWLQGAVADADCHLTTITMDQDHTVQAGFVPHGLTNFIHQGQIGEDALTSALDTAKDVDYERAEYFSGPIQSISKIITHALTLNYTYPGWAPWTPDISEPFIVKFYAGDATEEPDWDHPIYTNYVMGKMYSIGTIWGQYPGYKIEIEFDTPLTISAGWVSIQIDVDSGAGGWMLLMSSNDGSGDGMHYVRDKFTSEVIDKDIMLEIWGTEAMGALNPVILAYPLALGNMSPDGFSFRWAPGSGVADHYTLYLYENAEDYPLNPAHSWDVGLATSYNPCVNPALGNRIEFNWDEKWYWAVGAAASGEDEALSELSWFEIMGDPTIVDFPWNEDFEGTNTIPPGWTVENVDGNSPCWVIDTGETHSGTNAALHFYAYNSIAEEGWLISPPIILPVTTNGKMMLRWWNYSIWSSYLGGNTVRINTTNDPSAVGWQELWSHDDAKEEEWTEAEVSLSGYLGQTIYIAFVYEGYDGNIWIVDDISISESFDYPENVTVTIGENETEATITITGGNANEVPGASIPELPNSAFVPEHALVLEFFGAGPWTVIIDTQILWLAYYQNGTWTALENTSGTGFNFEIQSAKGGVQIPVAMGGGQDPTLPIELSSFSAVLTADMYVKIAWIAESETNHAGYNILRSEVEELSTALKLNAGLISDGDASGTQLSYQYLDTEVMESAKYYYWLESLSLNGETDYYGPLSVVILAGGEEQEIPVIPLETKLYSAFPNPFNPATNLRYSMKEVGEALIQVYNLKGQLVHSFHQVHSAPGYYQVSWDGRDQAGNPVASGIYFYRMSSGNYTATKKMIMSK